MIVVGIPFFTGLLIFNSRIPTTHVINIAVVVCILYSTMVGSGALTFTLPDLYKLFIIADESDLEHQITEIEKKADEFCMLFRNDSEYFHCKYCLCLVKHSDIKQHLLGNYIYLILIFHNSFV